MLLYITDRGCNLFWSVYENTSRFFRKCQKKKQILKLLASLVNTAPPQPGVLFKGRVSSYGRREFPVRVTYTLKETTSQTDYYLVNSSSKTHVFEDKMTEY